METEIKLLLPEGSRAAVESHPLLADAEARQAVQVSTYYDTPDFGLRGRGVTLRIRQADDSFVQTVKWRDGAAGLGVRGEAEWPVGPGGLDRDALERDPAALRHLGHDLAGLAPVFTTEISRTTRHLTLDGKTAVEVVVDEGEARAGERRCAISEVEIELKGGPVAPMLSLAADLARRGGLRLGTDAKSERGYALLTPDAPPQAPASEPALPAHVTLRQAFPRLVDARCGDLASELSGAGRGDVEGLHRLRAAQRRMRTVLELFAPHLDRDAAAGFDRRLAEFGRALGGGRDWDVFLTETLVEAERGVDSGVLAPLRAEAAARGCAAREGVAAAIAGPAPTALLLDLSLWAADGRWHRASASLDDRLDEALPRLLDRLERKGRRRGRGLKSLDGHRLHGLRKALKKLRYACEDVALPHRPKAAGKYLGLVKTVLGVLGQINDAAVAEGRVAEIAPPGRQDLAPAAAVFARWNGNKARDARRQLRRRWRRLRHADPFWS